MSPSIPLREPKAGDSRPPESMIREIYEGYYVTIPPAKQLQSIPPPDMWTWAVNAGVLDSVTEDIKHGGQFGKAAWQPSLWQDLESMCSLLCQHLSTTWSQEKTDEYLEAAAAEIANGSIWLIPRVHCLVARRAKDSLEDLKLEQVFGPRLQVDSE